MLDLMNGHLIVGATNISIEVVSSLPMPGTNGQIVINSTTNEIKVWYNSVWNTIGITITPGEATPLTADDGVTEITADDGTTPLTGD